MPLIETKGAASAQGFGGAGAGASGPVTYIEDVFSTYLYTGNGSTQTITNGIDLSGKGGLVWLKQRNGVQDHYLMDTVRPLVSGVISNLSSNTTGAALAYGILGSFNNNGFTDTAGWTTSQTVASWTFRKQPKFFDVVTYTGDGATTRNISHTLGVQPAAFFVKATSASGDWHCVFSYNGGSNYFMGDTVNGSFALNSTNLAGTGRTASAINISSTTIDVAKIKYDPSLAVYDVNAGNQNGVTYVAYLFAHDAGGFGLSGTDNVISCGSFTSSGSVTTIDLGYEPQWVLLKQTNSTGNWTIADNMRGMPASGSLQALSPNLSNAEQAQNWINTTSTGFTFPAVSGYSMIYIAIRRGPMKVPTSGTSVFSATARTPAGATYTASTAFTVDMVMQQQRTVANTVNQANVFDRLRGATKQLATAQTQAEATQSGITNFDVQAGYIAAYGSWSAVNWTSGYNEVYWNFRRAPSFFDVVCYTGTGSAQTLSHNLGVTPELMIVKWRTGATGDNWNVYHSAIGATGALYLNNTDATVGTAWNNTAPTATQFTVGTQGSVSAATYVAYLFATCAGVSKVGSYTGTGALQTINCGFTGGARFVLIKRTDSTGDWYVWDSARGIVAGSDPYLTLNTTAAEVTTTDWVDTYSAGFELSNAGGNNVNINGATYIFLSVA